MKQDRADAPPPRPEPQAPPADHPHLALWKAVGQAIAALPARFRSPLGVSGVLASDLFAFNAALSATIESQVVDTLNEARATWDPDGRFGAYGFVRRPQTFPDVVLATSSPEVEPSILMGIELKGWYVLAREREPSFRYRTTPGVCRTVDRLVVVPWALSQVISGEPRVFAPFVVGARHAAELRNWHWRYGMKGGAERAIELSTATTSYPDKREEISDRAARDRGGNFGRLARTGVLRDYVEQTFREDIAGIPLGAWQEFLALFNERFSEEDVRKGIAAIAARFPGRDGKGESIRRRIEEIADILASD